MRRYFIYLTYNGKNYHGWQIQPNGNSVQAELSSALTTILRVETPVVGAGRTDAGVHAKLMVAHFDGEVSDCRLLVQKLNGLLPADISIFEIRAVKSDAHARFDAVSRRYEYHVHCRKSPFLTDFSCRIFSVPNLEAMNEAASCLLDYSDFTSFSKLHTDTKTNICRVNFAAWKREGEELVFTIEADRFLRNMVRAIVGTLLCVGKGMLTVDDFCRIIEEKDRGAASSSAPACGLFLVGVSYPEHLFLE